MRDSTLEIRNQKLSTGHCEAIREGFRVISESLASDESKGQFLNHVILNNNGLSDAQLALILEGLSQIKVIRSFHSIGNELRQRSVATLGRLLRRDK